MNDIKAVTFNTLPTYAVIGGQQYPIDYGYRALMKIEIEMFSEHRDEDKILNALEIFYKNKIPEDINAATEYMIWFQRCGEEPETTKKGVSDKKAKRGYCFRQDAPLIYAAFRQQYGINLKKTDNEKLHWWEFIALFECLEESTKMAKVMYWRTCDLSTLSKEEKKFVKSMRELYELKESNDKPDMDGKERLVKRNADMKAYVRKRAEECLKR